jgi:hypothetical protein
MTKMAASVRVIAPRGSSRIDVLGFNASCRASASLLKPIAALRALTMQTMIQRPATKRTDDRAKRATRLSARTAARTRSG